jgi:hemin uptake protein HemP
MNKPGDGHPSTSQEQTPVPGTAVNAAASSVIPGPRTLESHDLLAGQSSVLICHSGEIYRLQTTRQGKLILTK